LFLKVAQVCWGQGTSRGCQSKNDLFIILSFPAQNTVVSWLEHLSQWKPLPRFIVLFLLAVDWRKVKNVLFEAIKHKMEPNFSPG
jgi:hypothetical protein